ncbi:hypothetical protein [Pseudomonas aeruginosa]|uniref:hypothetical protein n=1 Tax=Pseudomonas aeruginosa TaxID=287 RepID=UPI002237DF17|nr:hypothetical protein [Pseudomonas aeruginosa]MCW4651038.1 hypothetical protein [Pseudomonas aeruginosa]
MAVRMRNISPDTAKDGYVIALSFATAFLLMWARRPDLLVNPQFWAEDGYYWYSGAYNGSILSFITTPANGYFQTISKITAVFSLLAPIEYAPLLFNVVALSIRAACVSFLLSSRMGFASIHGRIAVALFAILMPEITEIHSNITNTHWYLALYLLMLLIAESPKTTHWKAHDIIVTVIASTSGPFCVFMMPIVLMRLVKNGAIDFTAIKINKIDIVSAIVILCSAIQAASIFLTATGTRTRAPLGASIENLANILSSRIFFGSFARAKDSSWLWDYPFFKYLICFAGMIAIIYVFIKADWRIKSIIIFPTIMLAFALAKPQMANTVDQWPKFMLHGERYLVIPNICLFAIYCYCISCLNGTLKKAVTVSAISMYILVVAVNFKIQEMPDLKWKDEVKKLDTAKPGEKVKLMINPIGWSMTINKK